MFEQHLLTLSATGDDYLSSGASPLSAHVSAFAPALPLGVRGGATRQAHAVQPVHRASARSARRITSAVAITAMVPRLALLHLILGSVGIVGGVLLWYVFEPASRLPMLFSGDALLLAVCACVALAASGVGSRRGETCARLVLLAADLVVGALALGPLGSKGVPAWLAALGYPLVALLLLAPLLATALFSPRTGVVALIVGVALVPLATLGALALPSLTALTFDGVGAALRLAAANAPWDVVLGEALALAIGGGLTIWCWWAAHRSTARAFMTFTESMALAQARENALETERAGLAEAVRRLAEEQARAQQQHLDLCRQMGALAAIAERLAAGDLSATRHLDPTLQEPLASLAAALGMLAQRVALTTNTQAQVRQTLAQKLAAAIEDQRETLTTLEHTVRAGSYDAEALAEDLAQTGASFGSSFASSFASGFGSSAPGAETPAPDGAPTIGGEERRHLAGRLAEETKHSVAWVAHLHGRYNEMQQTMRQLTRLLTTPSEPSADEADTLALGASDLRRMLANRWASSAVTAARPAKR